jgi:hypothetical protein
MRNVRPCDKSLFGVGAIPAIHQITQLLSLNAGCKMRGCVVAARERQDAADA